MFPTENSHHMALSSVTEHLTLIDHQVNTWMKPSDGIQSCLSFEVDQIQPVGGSTGSAPLRNSSEKFSQ